jgi:hypothetical protein
MDLYETNEEAYERGRADERQFIQNTVQKNGYDWGQDRRFSPLQHLLNWLNAR